MAKRSSPDIGFSNPTIFLDSDVRPAYRKFSRSRKRADAVVFATVAWHLRDHLWHHVGKPKLKKKFDADLFQACPELRLVRVLADAGKHHELDRECVTLVALVGVEGGGVSEAITPEGIIRGPTEPLTLVEADGSQHPAHQ